MIKISVALKLLSTFILANIPNVLFSQSATGFIYDSETKKPIPFTTVQIGKNFGVITNEEGRFEINMESFVQNDSLKISYLGYQEKQIAISDFKTNDTVFLKQSVNVLDAVYLLDKNLKPESIIDSVRANLSKNYPVLTQKASFFQRVKESNNPEALEFKILKADFIKKETLKDINLDLASLSKNSVNVSSNMYNDTFIDLYQKSGAPNKINVLKATKLYNIERNTSTDNIENRALQIIADKLDNKNSFKLRSGIFPVSDSIYLTSVFEDRVDSITVKYKNREITSIIEKFGFGEKTDFDFITHPLRYRYTLTNALDYNDEMVFVLSFEPEKNSAAYSGEIFVSASTYAILKLDYSLAEGKKGEKINLKLLLGVKYEQLDKSVLAIFQKNTNKTYFLKYLKEATEEYVYFNRSLTFIENSVQRKDRIKLKLDLLSEGIVSTENEVLMVNSTVIDSSVYDSFNQVDMTAIEPIQKYDPSKWEAYNIVAPSEAILNFDF